MLGVAAVLFLLVLISRFLANSAAFFFLSSAFIALSSALFFSASSLSFFLLSRSNFCLSFSSFSFFFCSSFSFNIATHCALVSTLSTLAPDTRFAESEDLFLGVASTYWTKYLDMYLSSSGVSGDTLLLNELVEVPELGVLAGGPEPGVQAESPEPEV